MALSDGEFHDEAHAEGKAVIARVNACVSGALLNALETWESVLAGRATLANLFKYWVTVERCELYTRAMCLWNCNEGAAMAVGVKDGRRVVLAISTFDDLSLEALHEEGQLDAARRAVKRIKDI